MRWRPVGWAVVPILAFVLPAAAFAGSQRLSGLGQIRAVNDAVLIPITHLVVATLLAAATLGSWLALRPAAEPADPYRTAGRLALAQLPLVALASAGMAKVCAGGPHTAATPRLLLATEAAAALGTLVGWAATRYPLFSGAVPAMVAMCWLDQGIQGVYVQLLPSPQVPAFEATPSPVEADAWHQLDFLLPAAKLGTAAAAVLLGSLTARRIGRALALTPVPLIFTLAVTALTAAAVPDSGWEELLGSDWTVAGSLIGFAASWALLPITRRPVSGRRP